MNLASLNKEVNELCKLVGSYIEDEQHKLSGDDINTKGLHDYVTHVDKNSEKMLVEGLAKILPDSGFLAEEQTVANSGKEYTWIIDPLDGTTNFIHHLPTFSISVALAKGHEVITGTVLDVRAKECFYTWEGSPSFMNGSEIRVSGRKKLNESLLATGFPYNDFSRQEAYLQVLGYMMKNTRGIRRFGSAAIDLVWVAAGRFDGFWEYSLKPWDVAAGSFIVKQAGGIVSDFKGGKDFIHGKEIVCGNQNIYAELIDAIKKFFR